MSTSTNAIFVPQISKFKAILKALKTLISTDLKNTGFHFQHLGKTRGYCSNTLHGHYTYENCKLFFLNSPSLRLFLYFRSVTRNLKK